MPDVHRQGSLYGGRYGFTDQSNFRQEFNWPDLSDLSVRNSLLILLVKYIFIGMLV